MNIPVSKDSLADHVPSLAQLHYQEIRSAQRSELSYAIHAMQWFYLILALVHFVVVTADYGAALVATAIATSFVCYAIGYITKSDKNLTYRQVLGFQLGLVALGGLNVVLHIHLSGDIHQSSNLILVMMLAIYLKFTQPEIIGITVSVVLCWILLTVVHPEFDRNLVSHYTFSIVFACLIFAIIKFAQQRIILARLSETRARLVAEYTLSQLNEKLRHQAEHDPLTDLANRRKMLNWLNGNWVKFERISLLICDVDNFKPFNDTYGHIEGDRILTLVARLLRNIADANGGLAVRTGGDEFVLLIPHLERQEIVVLAESVVSDVAKLFRHKGDIGLSIGSYTASTDKILDEEILLTHADQALYQAKNAGRNRAVCL